MNALVPMVRIVSALSPVKTETVETFAPEGLSLYEIVQTDKPGFEIWLDGEYIEPEVWRETYPKYNQLVNIRVIPQREILRTALMLASVIAISVAFPGAGWVAVTAKVLLTFAAFMLINALIPLAKPEQDNVDRLRSLTGAQNQVGRYSPIPRLYGRRRYFPPVPMTGLPFTEIVGNEQYLRAIYVLGYGPLDIGGVRVDNNTMLRYPTDSVLGSNVFIGNAAVSNFEDVEIELGNPEDITLYTSQIIEQAVQLDMNSEGDEAQVTYEDNVENIRTTEENVTEISLDIEFTQGLFSLTKKGKVASAEVTWKVEYRAAGSEDAWTTVNVEDKVYWYGGFLNTTSPILTRSSTVWAIRAADKQTQRRSIRWTVPEGQYDVRLTRLETYSSGDILGSTAARWLVLRSMRPKKPFIVPNTIVLAIRVKASDELSGTLDNLSVLATSILPVWDGEDWVEEATQNPAWAYVDALSGVATKRPVNRDTDINLDDILAWAESNEDNEFDFNYVFTDESTLFDKIRLIASAGRAAWAIRDNKISVVREEVNTIPRQIFSPRNSRNFSLDKGWPQVPHALRGQFVDENTWEDGEIIIYADGYDESTASVFESFPFIGVTKHQQVWKLGRFHLAQMELRPETFSFESHINTLISQRGDAIGIQIPTLGVGQASGRITALTRDVDDTVLTVTLDEFVFMEIGKDYMLSVMYIDAVEEKPKVASSVIPNISPGGKTHTLTTPFPEDVAVGDLVVFGEVNVVFLPAKIIRIEPVDRIWVQITAVPLAPEILTADQQPIPPYDPYITQPIDVSKLPPQTPTVLRIRSDETVLVRDADGSLRTQMVVDYSFPPGQPNTIIELRYVEINSQIAWHRVEAPSSDGSIATSLVEDGSVYKVQIRAKRGTLLSPWTEEIQHTVIGKTSPPSDVENFVAEALEFGLRLSWDEIEDLDRDSYEIRQGDDWDSALFVVRTKGTVYQLDVLLSGNHKYLIKAIDTTENYSVNATVANFNVAAPTAPEIVATFEGPDLVLSFIAHRGDFPILEHEIRRGGTDWNSATFVTRIKSTTYRQKADWSGSLVWRISSLDAAGNIGQMGTVTATVILPIVTSVNPQVIDNNVLLRWSAVAGTLPIDRYEVRKGTILANTDLVGAADTTFAAVLESQGGTYTYHIVPIDTAGNEGTSGSATALVNEPPDFVLRNDFRTDFEGYTSDDIVTLTRLSAETKHITRSQTALSFDGVNDYVEIAHGAELSPGATDLTIELDLYVKSTAAYSGDAFLNKEDEYEIGLSTLGELRVAISTTSPWTWLNCGYVIPVGVWHFISIQYDGTDVKFFINGVLVATIEHPDGGNLNTSTNNLHFGARNPDDGTHVPIKIAELRIWSTNPSDEDIAARFRKTLQGNEPGLAGYWRAQILRGNTLPDLTGNGNAGSVVGAVWERDSVEALAPFPVSETVGDRETIHGYTTPQEQITDGYPYVAQPVPLEANYTEIYDAGVVIPSSRITVTINSAAVVAGTTFDITISVRDTFEASWVDFPTGTNDVFATNFRYVKVVLTATAATDEAFSKLLDINTQLSTKRKTDEGSLVVTSHPTPVTFDVAFIDIDTITVSPQGTTPVIGVVDFLDVPNPTGFDIYLFDLNGNPVTGIVARWIARGV